MNNKIIFRDFMKHTQNALFPIDVKPSEINITCYLCAGNVMEITILVKNSVAKVSYRCNFLGSLFVLSFSIVIFKHKITFIVPAPCCRQLQVTQKVIIANSC